jgi:predicted RNase H-like nuclease (RuvC/YqgF family)
MESIAQMIVSADEFKSQMEIQRDELIGNYMKSQRLAIALGRQNRERTLHQALNEMSDHKHTQKKVNYEQILQRNISLIEQLKSKITDFERDNSTMADENEELRQFSLDGYQIAKNVSQMNEERDRLSIELADKSRTIQQLLETNSHLSDRLKVAQENAILLINRSSHHMRQFNYTH